MKEDWINGAEKEQKQREKIWEGVVTNEDKG